MYGVFSGGEQPWSSKISNPVTFNNVYRFTIWENSRIHHWRAQTYQHKIHKKEATKTSIDGSEGGR